MASITEAEMLARLRAACVAAGGQNAYARCIGVSKAYLSKVITGKKPPSAKILVSIGLRPFPEKVYNLATK